MENPPLHYRRYWKLQDEDYKLCEASKSILLGYIQSWGQTGEEASNSIKGAIKMIRLKLKGEKLEYFLEEIRKIERGNFESEVVQIADILKKYKALIKIF